MVLMRTFSKSIRMKAYFLIVLAIGLIPCDYPSSRYVSTWQTMFYHFGGWTWISLVSLFWFLLPPLMLIAYYRKRSQTFTRGKQIGFALGWSILCTTPAAVEETLLYALLMFGYTIALEPAPEQEAVLLRPSAESQQTQPEQLLRAACEQTSS